MGDALAALMRSKDIASAFYNFDELLRVSAQVPAAFILNPLERNDALVCQGHHDSKLTQPLNA